MYFTIFQEEGFKAKGSSLCVLGTIILILIVSDYRAGNTLKTDQGCLGSVSIEKRATVRIFLICGFPGHFLDLFFLFLGTLLDYNW